MRTRTHSAAGEMRRIDVPFKIDRAASSLTERVISGYASVFNVLIPSFNEIVDPGAFDRTLKERKDRVKVLWQHDPMKPIGLPSLLEEDAIGLKFTAQLANTASVRDEYMPLMLPDTDGRAVVDRTSIGFSIAQDRLDPATGVWHLMDCELYEFSPVTFPANEQAIITDARSGSKAMEQARSAMGMRDDRVPLSEDDAKYGMAVLMGARGASSFADLPPEDRSTLYERLATEYERHGLTPPPFSDRPMMYNSVQFAHDETTIFAARSLQKRLSDVTSAARHAVRAGVPFDSSLLTEVQSALDALRAIGLEDVSGQVELLRRGRAAAHRLGLPFAGTPTS